MYVNKKQVYYKIESSITYYKHWETSLQQKSQLVTFGSTIVAVSLIKSSTTFLRTWSTYEQRKSSETKLGEALEHDDWKNKNIKSMTYHVQISW